MQTDYLQYSTTSLNTIFQMLFAYQQNPQAFGDQYDANGMTGANGIPDIIDEARWGLDWALKMNPKKNLMFNRSLTTATTSASACPPTTRPRYGRKGQNAPFTR